MKPIVNWEDEDDVDVEVGSVEVSFVDLPPFLEADVRIGGCLGDMPVSLS